MNRFQRANRAAIVASAVAMLLALAAPASAQETFKLGIVTFLSGPNSAGSPFVSETPEPFGPRKRDQSVSAAAAAAVISARVRRMEYTGR